MSQTAERLKPGPALPTPALEVVKRSPTIGAELRGVDWTRPVDAQTAAAIHDALLKHKVIWFRDVDITPQAQLAFGRLFGECTVHPFVPRLPDVPEMVVLDNHQDN